MPGKRAGQCRRPAHGQARTLAKERQRRCRVTEQSDPSPGPPGHPHLAHRVEVEVVGRPYPIEKLGDHPPGAVELGKEQPLVLRGVAVVEAVDGGAAEQERRERLRPRRMQRHGAAGRVVHEHFVRGLERAAQPDRGDVDAPMPDEVRLGPERQPAGQRVQPVGADDQVEAAWGGPVERDVDAVPVLGQRRDRVVEEKLGVVAGGLPQDRREVAAGQLDRSAAGALHRQRAGAEEGQRGRRRGGRA
jgi:hypothetical protein